MQANATGRRPVCLIGEWLVREILAARDRRLAGYRVEDPPPPRRDHLGGPPFEEFSMQNQRS
jgi:hypothetical protein